MTDQEINDMVQENMGLVISIVNKYKVPTEQDRQDLIQHGSLGLWEAIKRHQEEKGKISTFATRNIRWKVNTAFTKMKKKNKLNFVSLDKIDAADEQFEVLLEYMPTNLDKMELDIIKLKLAEYSFREMAEELGCSIGHIKKRFYKLVKTIREINLNEEKKSSIRSGSPLS